MSSSRSEPAKKWCVVVPTCRPERYEQFLDVWEDHFLKHHAQIITVWDTPDQQILRPTWVPRQSDMCRSWGFYQAWLTDADYILSLDDDVSPPQGDDPFYSYEHAFKHLFPCENYLNVGALTTADVEMRGFPYKNRDRECVVQYGGWHGVPDLDGATQIVKPVDNSYFWEIVLPVPRGCAATCCAMNFAFKREYAPIMWQMPMIDGLFNRFGDIWSGLVQKRVLDVLKKVMVINGYASVYHQRASDPQANLEKERPGMQPNEDVWEYLDISGVDTDMMTAFQMVTTRLGKYLGRTSKEYEKHFFYCREQWLELFQ